MSRQRNKFAAKHNSNGYGKLSQAATEKAMTEMFQRQRTSQSSDLPFCPQCGAETIWWRGSTFCPKCGFREGCCD